VTPAATSTSRRATRDRDGGRERLRSRSTTLLPVLTTRPSGSPPIQGTRDLQPRILHSAALFTARVRDFLSYGADNTHSRNHRRYTSRSGPSSDYGEYPPELASACAKRVPPVARGVTAGPRRFCFDLDGTLCTNTEGAYERRGLPWAIERVNALIDSGHQITIFTARRQHDRDRIGPSSRQPSFWIGACATTSSVSASPGADVYIDDKALHADAWRYGHALARAPGSAPPRAATVTKLAARSAVNPGALTSTLNMRCGRRACRDRGPPQCRRHRGGGFTQRPTPGRIC